MTNYGTQLPSRIQTATSKDSDNCIQSLLLAFEEDPVCRWVWPDNRQYEQAFPHFAKAFAGKSFRLGTAQSIDNYSGVALWLPPAEEPNEHEVIQVLQDTVVLDLQEAVFLLFEQMDAYHPTEPHWYLPLMGVVPHCQSRGYGSALLQNVLEECDSQNLLAYLEATNPRNMSLYQRYGFERIGTIQALNSPVLFPMLRKPRVFHNQRKTYFDMYEQPRTHSILKERA